MSSMPADRRAYNEQLIEQFRANHGAPEGRQVLLLTTTGRRSGEARTTPMMFIRQDGLLLVVASNAGAPAHPDWFLNLVADPRVHVEIEAESYDATAVVPDGEERDRIFAGVAASYPFFADHQAGIERTIPVVILERVSH
jgi:deazaflavin-dependent oxidoreductase (nitroreductase family)